MHRITRTSVGNFFWEVFNLSGDVIADGYCMTRDNATRAARNFIKRNQNEVFSRSVETVLLVAA